jgi:hypothetical protein
MEAVYRYRSSDVRDFEVYPLRPGATSRRDESSRLVQRARQMGRLAGQVVAVTRQAQELIQDMRQRLREQGSELSAEVLGRTRTLGEEAAAEANALREDAGNKAGEPGQRVRRAAERTWQRGRAAVHEHPAEVVLAAGIAGLVLGSALRLGRSHRVR